MSPENKIKYVLVGEKYEALLADSLKNIGLTPLFVPNNPNVDVRLSGHADLSVFYPGGKELFLAPYLKNTDFVEKIKEIGVFPQFLDISQSNIYPFDAQLNVCLLKESFIFNPKTASVELIKYLTNHDLSPIPVKQGYTKCCICPVDGFALITGDRGIASGARSAGADVLEIGIGHIALEGFEYGFIGGAGFRYCKDKLAFTGLLDEHPDRKNIFDFLEKYSLEPVFLTNKPIFDVGSIIPLY